MEMDKAMDRAMDKASILIEGIIDNHFAGSRELSKAYINKQYPEDLSRLGLMKSEDYRQAIITKKKLRTDNQTEVSVSRMMDRVIIEHQKRRKEMDARFSDATHRKLKDFTQDRIERLLDSLIDFEEAISISKAKIDISKFMTQLQHRSTLAVQGADLLLENGLLDDEDRKHILALKSFHDEMLPKEGVSLDTDQIVMLIKTLWANTKGLEFAY